MDSARKGEISASEGKKGAGVKKHTYLEMVQVAILTLNERGGSSRQEIWKCIDARFPEANHKSFLLAMRKLAADGTAIIRGKNINRFTMEKNFKLKALKRMKQGLPLQMVLSSKHMTDLVKKKMKKVAKKPARKAAKKGKKKQSRASSASARKSAAKGRKNGASAKDKAKAKAKQNKISEGSNKSKAKVADKRKQADKKMKAATKANTN